LWESVSNTDKIVSVAVFVDTVHAAGCPGRLPDHCRIHSKQATAAELRDSVEEVDGHWCEPRVVLEPATP